MRHDTARAIAAIGVPISPQNIGAAQKLFQSQHEAEPYRDVIVTRDARYGPHERNRLDVFQAAGSEAGRPVVVYVHGGGFVAGDKRAPGGVYYDNIGLWAVRNGFVGVTMTYRLAPHHKYPAGAEDVGRAVRWVQENIATFGGDPEGLVLFGQSAGATHVASYVARPELHVGGSRRIRGAIVFSGVYDFRLFPLADNVLDYLGDAPGAQANGSALPSIAQAGVPLLIGIAELDPPMFHEQAMALTEALYDRLKRFPNVLYLPQHNHISQVAHLNAAGNDDSLATDRLREFIEIHTVLARG